MKRISLVAALLGAVVLAFAGIAMAGTGANSGANWGGGVAGNGTAVTHYSAAYTDSFFGGVSCTGVHQVKKSQDTQESFTCTSTSGSPLANVAPGETINWGPGTWLSDSDHSSLDKTFKATVSADGMSYTAVATY
jgi:hypothetical protein